MSSADGSPMFDRRMFLRGVGVSIALPLLDALPRASTSPTVGAAGAAGVAPSFPARAAFVFLNNGIHMADWTPKDDGEKFTILGSSNRSRRGARSSACSPASRSTRRSSTATAPAITRAARRRS